MDDMNIVSYVSHDNHDNHDNHGEPLRWRPLEAHRRPCRVGVQPRGTLPHGLTSVLRRPRPWGTRS